MTNLPSFIKRMVPALAILIIALLLVALPRFNALYFSHMHYEQCSDLAVKTPDKALLLARQWREASPDSPMGKHCEAIALYATRDFTHAGDAFARLAKEASPTNPLLAARLFFQGAEAYEAANKNDLAKQCAAAALLLKPDDAAAKDLLTEIAKVNTPSTPTLGK